jgi:hypothetical protein
VNFAVDISRPVEGSNNSFRVGRNARDCAPTATAGGARAGSDTLTLRHAGLEATTAHAGRIQIYSRRLGATGTLDLFADGRAPGAIDENAQVRDLEVHIWYIANDSVGRRGWPALRVKSLTEAGGAAQFRDEEVLPGVEDLQVELGVVAGAVNPRVSYVAADAPSASTARVLAVRLWLRVRSDATDRGFIDARSLAYADVAFMPTAFEATQRRVLIERTVALRNLPP